MPAGGAGAVAGLSACLHSRLNFRAVALSPQGLHSLNHSHMHTPSIGTSPLDCSTSTSMKHGMRMHTERSAPHNCPAQHSLTSCPAAELHRGGTDMVPTWHRHGTAAAPDHVAIERAPCTTERPAGARPALPRNATHSGAQRVRDPRPLLRAERSCSGCAVLESPCL